MDHQPAIGSSESFGICVHELDAAALVAHDDAEGESVERSCAEWVRTALNGADRPRTSSEFRERYACVKRLNVAGAQSHATATAFGHVAQSLHMDGREPDRIPSKPHSCL